MFVSLTGAVFFQKVTKKEKSLAKIFFKSFRHILKNTKFKITIFVSKNDPFFFLKKNDQWIKGTLGITGL